MSALFTCSISKNLLQVDFGEQWDHKKHYLPLFNATGLIGRTMMATDDWALLVNWNTELIKVPEEERICIRTLRRQMEFGLKTAINVVVQHPISDWQLDKVSKENPNLVMFVSYDPQSAISKLRELGYDTQVEAIPFDSNWLHPTPDFVQTLDSLGLNSTQFIQGAK